MSITISAYKPADRPAILELLDKARADNMSEQERARQGFIQGNINENMLARFQAGSGVFIARKQQIVGVAMTSLPGMVSKGPPAHAIETVRDAKPKIADDEIFLYGPATIGQDYRGQGILTQLLTHICNKLQDKFKLGVAFVELANQKSLSVHRHYPMSEVACFTIDERKYTVFTFSPKQVLRHYANIF